MKHSKFDKIYNKVISESKNTDNIEIENIISEGFIKDLLTGGLVGGAGMGLTLAAKGAAACVAGNLAAGLTIGFPLGAVAGAAVWLVHLIQDKIAKKEDEEQINKLLKKINDKSFDIDDNEELETLKAKYKNDIDDLAKGNVKTDVDDKDLAE